MITQQLINTAISAAIKAGDEILKVYNSFDFEVEYKEDNSPVTIADKKASKIILEELKPYGFPILSEEETEVPYEERKNWKILWVVDPLDGTKEFIKRNDEFTINIALIGNNEPTFGIIYLPVLGEIFYGGRDLGSFKILAHEFEGNIMVPGKEGETLPNTIREDNKYLVTGSRSHGTKETQTYFENLKEKHQNISFVKLGSALKFCRLAEGKVDLYPRFQYCMEWDTAAGHAILQGVGKDIVKVDDGEPLVYNKENLLSPFFIAQ